jgi:hypothetical protein
MLAFTRRSPALCLPLLFVLTLPGCGGDSPSAPTRDWIELAAIQPPEGTTFAPGEQVTFSATVDCTVGTSEAGTVTLIVQAPGVINVPVPVALARGTKTVTLTGSATMPASGTAVSVLIPLWVRESDTTAMMKRVSYSVR